MKASGVAPYTYTVVHYRSQNASGSDSTTVSSNGAPAALVTRRYIHAGGTGTLSGIDLGVGVGEGTFSYSTLGWREATAWPTGATRTSTYLNTGTHATQSFNSPLDAAFYSAYAVDSAGRILRDRRHDGDPTAYTQRVFGYDELGRYTGTRDVSDLAWNCGGSGRFDPNYGDLGCPIDTATVTNQIGYDDAGNMQGPGTVRGDGDQLDTMDGFLDYAYDADGNVTARTFHGYGIGWNFRWSADNRLLASGMRDDSVSLESVSLEYDPMGEPVVKRDSTGRVTHVTLYDGGSILADLDSAGNRIVEYVYDEGTDRPYALLTGATSVTGAQYFVQDDMGNIEGTLYDSTHVASTIDYEGFGAPEVTGDSTNRLMWKGLPYDPDLGLIYMRARWYDPSIGRFMSEDPLGLQGGINPYVFANDDPINGFDPSGMDEYLTCIDWYDETYVNGKLTHEQFLFTECTDPVGAGDGAVKGPSTIRACKATLLVPLDPSARVTFENSRVIPLFAPAFAAALSGAIRDLNGQGIVPQIDQGYRTNTMQVRMGNGGSGPNPAARPGYSLHQAGYAVDISGTASRQFGAIKAIMASYGMAWGGNFRPRPDLPHFYIDPFRNLSERHAAVALAAAFYKDCVQ
jgi:RHS repeat-associated protein